MAKEIVHEDFGEKIGGAKKDLWAARGLYVDDLLGMNEREAEKYVKKDNVWKKPDYNALIQSGVPVDILYFRKVVRDSLNASPRYLQTVQDAMDVFDALIIDGGYCERISHGIGGGYIRATQKGRDNPVITDKLVNALYFRGERDFERKIVQGAVKKQFGVPAEQKVPRGYDIRFNDGKRTYSKNNDWIPNTYYVTKGYTILKTNFATREEALKWVQDLARQRGASGKQRFVPQQLSRVRRRSLRSAKKIFPTREHSRLPLAPAAAATPPPTTNRCGRSLTLPRCTGLVPWLMSGGMAWMITWA